jgi:hypothetical protein
MGSPLSKGNDEEARLMWAHIHNTYQVEGRIKQREDGFYY